MDIARNTGQTIRQTGDSHQGAAAADPLSRWLNTSPAAQELAAGIRESLEQRVPASVIDRLETRAAQSAQLSAPSSTFERVLNGFGVQTKRQSILAKQASEGLAEACSAKSNNEALNRQIESKVSAFCQETFRRSRDLTTLTQILEGTLQSRQRISDHWDMVDRQASELDRRLQPSPSFVSMPEPNLFPALDSFGRFGPYSPPGFNGYADMLISSTPSESESARQYRQRAVREVYTQGEPENFRLRAEHIKYIASLAPVLSTVTDCTIVTPDGTTVVEVNSNLPELRRFAQICNEVSQKRAGMVKASLMSAGLLPANSDLPDVGAACTEFEKLVSSALTSISNVERDINNRVISYITERS
jgi:hypothetical protein